MTNEERAKELARIALAHHFASEIYENYGHGKNDTIDRVLAHDAEIRLECADKAVEYVFFEGDNDPVDENGFQAPSISSDGLRAAIMGKE